MKNKDIREARGSIAWADIADRIGISESTLFYHLRKDMKPEVKEKIMKAISDLKQNN